MSASLLLLSFLSLNAEPSVELGGKPFTVAALEKLGPETVDWKDHDVARKAYGVALPKVLEQLGLQPSDKKSWRKLVVATGADGYKAVFTAAEASRLFACSSGDRSRK